MRESYARALLFIQYSNGQYLNNHAETLRKEGRRDFLKYSAFYVISVSPCERVKVTYDDRAGLGPAPTGYLRMGLLNPPTFSVEFGYAL